MTRYPTPPSFRPSWHRAAVRAVGLALLAPTLLAPALLAPAGARAAGPISVSVSGGWFRYLLASIPAGGYMTLHNTSAAPAVLTGAVSPACGSLMLHRTLSADGTERMVAVAKVPVPAHGTLRFAPGGYHLMCMQPRMQPHQTVPVTLIFADGGRVTASFTVFGANGAPEPAAKPGKDMRKMRM